MNDAPGLRAHIRATGARPAVGTTGHRVVTLPSHLTKSAAAAPPEHDGAMLALRLAPADAAALAIPGGEPAADLHITLVYLGKARDLTAEHVAALQRAVAAIAATQGPITTTVTGLAQFPGKLGDRGAPVYYAAVDPAPIVGVRAALVSCLLAAHLPYRDDYATYTPHITLRYGPPRPPSPEARPLTFAGIDLCIGGETTTVPFGLRKGGGWIGGMLDLFKARPPKGAVSLFDEPAPPPPGAGPTGEVQHPGIRGGQGHVRLVTKGPREGQMRFMYGDDPQPEAPAAPEPSGDDARFAALERLTRTHAGRVSLARVGREAYDEWSRLTPHTEQQRTDFADLSAAAHQDPGSDGVALLPLLARNREALLTVDTRRGGLIAFETDPPRRGILTDARGQITAKRLTDDAIMLLDWDIRHHETDALKRVYDQPLNRAEQLALMDMLKMAQVAALQTKLTRWQTQRHDRRAALRAKWNAVKELDLNAVRLLSMLPDHNTNDTLIATYEDLAKTTARTNRIVEEHIPPVFSALFAAHGGSFVVTLRAADEVQPGVKWGIPPETVGGWYDPLEKVCWVRSLEGHRVDIAAHEMGHGVDHACGLLLTEQPPVVGSDFPYRSDTDPAFQKIYQKHRRNKALWDYMRKNPHEMFAEGYALWVGCSAHGSKGTLLRDAPDLSAYFDALHARLRTEMGLDADAATGAEARP